MPAQPAGPCELHLGRLQITFLPDGEIRHDPLASYPGSPASLWAGCPEYLDEDGQLVMSLGALLVRTAGHTVLVDLGWGPTSVDMVDPATGRTNGRIEGGRLLASLEAAGTRPEEVEAVLFSHLHRDHVGWLANHAGPCFPNATYLLSEAELAYWHDVGTPGVGPAPGAEHLEAVTARCRFVADGTRPFPGIDVLATPGHTPGHLSFVLSSGAQRAVVLGDAVHCPIEITEPELAFVVDVDKDLARRTRAHLERELLEPETLAVGPHFPDLVFGRLLRGEARPSWRFDAAQPLA